MPKFNKDYSSREEYERAKQIHMESIIEKITNPEIIDRESTVEEIAEILKNNKIDQIIIAGEKQQNKERQALRLHPDLDSEMALYLLNNFNKRKPEEMYNDGAVVSVINKNGTGKELIEDKKGVKIYLDNGGNWLKIEKDGETTTLYIDHHGTGQRDPTSGAKMTAEIMEKAGILKEKPEWLNKLIDFVNDIDNLTYLDKKDKKGNKTFTESYFRNEWPASLYALVEKKISLNLLIELCEKGIIKDLTKPFTDEELNGEIGKIKVGDQTIKDLCLEQRKEMSTTLDVGIKNSIQNNEKEGINLEKTRLGKIIYQNYFKIRGKVNIIPDHLAFKATIAKGYDTYIAFNKQKGVFFINSKNQNLSNVVEELNKKYPGCATDIRGVMVYGKMVEGLNEEEFLNIIDPKILKEKNKVPKKGKQNTEGNVANPDVSEPKIKSEMENAEYEAKKTEIENYINDRIIFTGTDGGFKIVDVSNMKKKGAGLSGDVRRKYSDNNYEVITYNDEHLKSLFRDLKYGGDAYSWHMVDNYINKGKKYLIVGISNRTPGVDPERNGSLFASIEDTGKLPKNIEIFMEKILIDKYEEVRLKRQSIYDQLPTEYLDKFNARYNKALEELNKETSNNNEETINSQGFSLENNDYETQKENIEKRKKEAEELHDNSILTASDNGFMVKESKYSYEIAKDLRAFIQKQASANQTGVIYKFKDDDNIYNYAVSTYDTKRGAGIGYVGYSVRVDKDTLLTDEEIYGILENNLNAAFDQKFPNKETWQTDKDTHINSIEKNNLEKIKAKYEIELAELDKKYNKNQETTSKEDSDEDDTENNTENSLLLNEKIREYKALIEEDREADIKLAELLEMISQLPDDEEGENEEPQKTEGAGNDEEQNEKAIETTKTKINETEKNQTYKKIMVEDFSWSFPNYINKFGELKIGDKLSITVEEFTQKQEKRSILGRVFSSSTYKTIKLEKPFCELKITQEGSTKIYKLDNISQAINKTDEILSEYARKTASNLGEVTYIPYDYIRGSEKIENNILYYIRENILSEIKKDREEKPFLYFAVEKSNNSVIINIAKNENTGTLDLRKLGRDWIGLERKYLVTTAENEGFFEYNILGFIKIIKNIKEIQKEKGVAAKSDQAIYKIVGPNEEIIADNIQGYNEATKIYWEKTSEYQKVVEEEFNKLNNNKR